MMYQGVVSSVSSFPYQNKKLWSFQLKNDRTFYRTGEIQPKFEVGDYVTFQGIAGKDGKVNADTKSVEIKKGEQQSSGVSAGIVGSGNRQSNEAEPTPDQDRRYQTKAERLATQARIEIQSCRNSALEMAKLLLSNGAVNFTEKTKAAAKAEIIEALVTHYESKFLKANGGVDNSEPKIVGEEKLDEEVPY